MNALKYLTVLNFARNIRLIDLVYSRLEGFKFLPFMAGSDSSLGWTRTHIGTMVKIPKYILIISKHCKYPLFNQGVSDFKSNNFLGLIRNLTQKDKCAHVSASSPPWPQLQTKSIPDWIKNFSSTYMQASLWNMPMHHMQT